MTSIRTVTAVLVLGISGSLLQLGARAQDGDPYIALHQYDYQTRKPVYTIFRQIQGAGTDKAKRASIEGQLIAVLQDKSATLAGKQEAARFLWEIGTARSVPVLAKMLPNPETNNIARYALERNSDPSAAAALRAALSTAKGEALIGVINSIGNRGDAAAIPALKRLAAGSDMLSSEAAVTALGKIGTSASVAALKSLPGNRPSVYNSMLRSAEKIASTGNRAEALSIYEGLTAPTYPEVIRAGGLNGLAAYGSPKTGAVALSIALSATDPILQRGAARILGIRGTPTDTQRARAAWSRLPAPAQVALLSAWSDRKEVTVAPVVVAAFKNDNPDVRSAAIRAAAHINGAAVVPALAEFAGGGDQAQVARDTLAHMGGAGVETSLIHLTEQGKPEVRTAVINILAERSTSTSNAALLKAAGGSDSRVASTAIKALGRTAGVEQEPALTQILVETKADDVRDAAQSAIVAIAQRSGDRNRAAEPLLTAMDHASDPGKVALIAALAEVGGDRALDVITKAVRSSDADVHNAALAALANTWSDARALSPLMNIAKNSSSRSERVQALRGYLRLAGADDRASSETRLTRIREAMAAAERPEEKRQALSVLRDIRTQGAVELAARSLDDSDLVAEASDAIIYLAAPQKKNNNNLEAVKGQTTDEALDKVIRTVKDDNIRAQARKLREG